MKMSVFMEQDLFSTIVEPDKLNISFASVRDAEFDAGARHVMNEVFNSVPAIDKDFIKQFQSHGFDARVWELYLMAVCQEYGFPLDREHDKPDFIISMPGRPFCIEAVTANPIQNVPSPSKLTLVMSKSEKKFNQIISELFIQSVYRLGSALFSKLQKKYWEKYDWVSGKPLILAVAPFYHSLAHYITDTPFIEYLYGIKDIPTFDENGNLHIHTIPIREHTFDGKTIPSNFFAQPGAENISAILFSNSGTIAKFNRMGKLKGYCNPDQRMYRYGLCYNHDPNATTPLPFQYEVGVNGPEEKWAQGLSMFHNPNALHPIDPAQFPGILHGYFNSEHKQFWADVPDFHPYNSETHSILPKD